MIESAAEFPAGSALDWSLDQAKSRALTDAWERNVPSSQLLARKSGGENR